MWSPWRYRDMETGRVWECAKFKDELVNYKYVETNMVEKYYPLDEAILYGCQWEIETANHLRILNSKGEIVCEITKINHAGVLPEIDWGRVERHFK